MKTDINTLQDLFKISYETYEDSREEEKQVTDMYHNRQYTSAELNTLKRRGQPEETFNIIKLFGRLLVGYYSTVVNTVKVQPRQQSDEITSRLLHDVVQYTFENNHFETEGDKIKLDGILTGLMCAYLDVVETGETDDYGRPIRRIDISHVSSKEILLDPMSKKEDYSDARYIHRFKWVSEDYLRQVILKNNSESKAQEIIDNLAEYENHVNQNDTEFTNYYKDQFVGLYKRYDNYLLIHSVIVDDEGKSWSVFWCGNEEIDRKEITYNKVKFPYRIQKVHSSDKAEYYGLFREVVQSQRAINQALLKIQLMANTQKVMVEDGAVHNLEHFIDSINRVTAVIRVKQLDKVKIENTTQEVAEQYAIIDKAFDRIQRVLGINDSFLGMAFASDSGRKVKLQQNATTLSLRYVTIKIEQFYRLLGWDIVNLVQQYYTANEVLNLTDQLTGQRWVEINAPMKIWSGRIDQSGNPIMDVPFEEVLDPENGEPMVDENENYLYAPVPEEQTEIAFSKVDLSIDTTAYNDEDERNQLMLETVLQGPIGNTLLQFNPVAYMKAAALSIKSIKTKHSPLVAELLENTANMISQQPTPEVGMIAAQNNGNQQPRSQELKLPQNTNEF